VGSGEWGESEHSPRTKQLYLAGAGRKAHAVMFGAQEKMKHLILNNTLNSEQTHHSKSKAATRITAGALRPAP